MEEMVEEVEYLKEEGSMMTLMVLGHKKYQLIEVYRLIEVTSYQSSTAFNLGAIGRVVGREIKFMALTKIQSDVDMEVIAKQHFLLFRFIMMMFWWKICKRNYIIVESCLSSDSSMYRFQNLSKLNNGDQHNGTVEKTNH
ncbi:CLUMA_CG016831, isoform A [Clunio marinus]|uniref:CLUMA_CG016831, isoform A n=1 Tax=Clunio marinus TaxID=568069 RepID=A0A1J1ITN7_9DIPT|nr:CLUMA_CG016831, isoform A [Clunio marinus]